MAIILGIDPGSRVTGYGVIRQVGRQLSYLGSGCIRTKVDDLPSRLKLIYAGVTEIITQFQPDYFAIEQVFMAKNADSALKLGQARGVAIVAAVNQELPVFEYAARQVKQTVVGIGSAEKSEVQHMVRTLLKLPANPQADAADALAIAITHCHVSQNAMQMSESRLTWREGDCVKLYRLGQFRLRRFNSLRVNQHQTRMMPQTGWRDGFTLPRNRT